MTLQRCLIMGLLLALAAAQPALAQSIDLNPVTTMLQSIVDALTGPLGLVVGTLAIAGVGLAWLFGYVNFATAAWTLVGVVLVAAAPTVAATFFA